MGVVGALERPDRSSGYRGALRVAVRAVGLTVVGTAVAGSIRSAQLIRAIAVDGDVRFVGLHPGVGVPARLAGAASLPVAVLVGQPEQ